MQRLAKVVALLASVSWLVGCGPVEKAPPQGQSRSATLNANLGNDFSGNYLWVHGTRSQPVDAKYPCLNEVTACLALDALGRSEALTDLCPSVDTPEGTWRFEYALYTDKGCSQVLANVNCLITGDEALSPGENHNLVECLTDNAWKDFYVCVYDPTTGAGIGYCNGRLLIVHSNFTTQATDVQAKQMATGVFDVVDLFDASDSTPAVADLARYDVALVYSNMVFADPVALGNNLADYFDLGGRVVTAVGANSLGWAVEGRFGADYLLIDPQPVIYNPDSLGDLLEPLSPLLKDVVTLVEPGGYHGAVGATKNGGIVVARWASGAPLVVRGTIDGRNRADLNLFPVSADEGSDHWTGNGAELIRNALLYR